MYVQSNIEAGNMFNTRRRGDRVGKLDLEVGVGGRFGERGGGVKGEENTVLHGYKSLHYYAVYNRG